MIDRTLAQAVAVALGLAAVSSAYAAETTGTLEEVIVTAQKREQRSQDVGIAVSTVSGAELASIGAVQATDITKSMPAVVLTQPNGPSSFSLSIRGVTQNDFADHQESPAAIYVDDVYVSQMAGLAFSLFDVDRVEVLRGPQGTLFGRNATGGLANFVTRRPTDEAGGYVDLTVGQRNLTRIEGAINGPLSSGVNARLSFQSNHYDPIFKNIAGGAPDAENGNDYAVRGQLLFKDVAGGSLLLNARASRQDVRAGSWEQLAINPQADGRNTLAGPNDNPWGTCNGCNASGIPSAAPYTTTNNQAGYAKIRTSGLTLKFANEVAAGINFTGIADFSKLRKDYQEDSDVTPYTIFQFFNGSDVKQKSIELRLNGGDEKLNWTTGLYGLDIDGKYYIGWQGPAFFGAAEYDVPGNPNAAYSGYSAAPGPWPYSTTPYPGGGVPGFLTGALADPNGGLPATRSPYSLRTKSYAAFGQFEYRFNDLVGLTIGGRFTRDKKDYAFSWAPYLYYPQGTTGAITQLHRPNGPVLGDYASDRSDNLWAGKAQLDFHLSRDQLLYVSYNRGVKGGGFTAPLFPATIANLADLSFKPEVLTSYEVGLKSEFLEHTLRVNSAVYYYDYKDYQALIYTISLNQLIKNADAKHKGAETEIEWAPNEAWRLGLGVSYVDAVVKDVAGLVDATFTPVIGDYVPPNAPRWSGNAMVRYTFPVGGGKVALQADGNYLTKFWFNIGDAPSVEQAAYGVMNARVSYTNSAGNVEVGASVENLADKHYAVMGFDNTGVNGLAQRYPGMPRWWKVHASYKF
jgi:iron complex outermembrane receptor protein